MSFERVDLGLVSDQKLREIDRRLVQHFPARPSYLCDIVSGPTPAATVLLFPANSWSIVQQNLPQEKSHGTEVVKTQPGVAFEKDRNSCERRVSSARTATRQTDTPTGPKGSAIRTDHPASRTANNCALGDTTIYEMEQRGEFPRRFYLTARCVVWDLAEVEVWIEERAALPILL